MRGTVEQQPAQQLTNDDQRAIPRQNCVLIYVRLAATGNELVQSSDASSAGIRDRGSECSRNDRGAQRADRGNDEQEEAKKGRCGAREQVND